MKYSTLSWEGPFLLSTLAVDSIPQSPGVYVFAEYPEPLQPNPLLPPCDAPERASGIERVRLDPGVLYVGKAANLKNRLSGYIFRPYLEINRRRGTQHRHEADRHKGRALLHAHQYFNLQPLYVRWSWCASPSAADETETALIRELRPSLNTSKVLFP